MFNQVTLIGYLGRDPEIRYTQQGSAVGNFSIATSESWKDKGGQKQEKTEWHSCVAWGKLADFVAGYLKKGSLVLVQGKLQTRDWTDNQNVKHYKTEIVAANIRFVGGRKDAQGGGQEGQGRAQSAPDDTKQYQEEAAYGGTEPEDDIPF